MTSRILIVEDEDFLVLALRDNLEAKGYITDLAQTGEEAMKHIRANPPDLILLDILMPMRDGFYVLTELKKEPKLAGIPVIVLSNLAGDEKIKHALSLGANEYFVKSEHMVTEVMEKINEYLHQ